MGATYLGCLSALITAAGYAFSVLTVLINLADVTSDVVVAVQFHRDGDTTWFWLVVSSLLIAHLVYVVVGLEVLPRQDSWSWFKPLPWPLRIVVLLIIAQVTPLLNLIFETREARKTAVAAKAMAKIRAEAKRERRRRRREDKANGVEADRYRLYMPGELSTSSDSSDTADEAEAEAERTLNDTRTRLQGAMAEELDDIAASKLVGERMQNAARDHFDKFGLFYVESAVEAAPQAIIQLLAITFLGRASPAQLVSLCCSLFSITSKAFVISKAYDVRVMAFKFALAAHDVFSTFYLFSTLVAQETTKDTDFFGLEVSWLGYIWLWKIVVYACVGTLTAGLAVVGQLVREAYDKNCVRDTALMSALVTLGCGPIVLALEACKLTWYTVVMLLFDGSNHANGAAHSLVLSFLSRDDKEQTRLRFICECAMAHRAFIGMDVPMLRGERAERRRALGALQTASYPEKLAAALRSLPDHRKWPKTPPVLHDTGTYTYASAYHLLSTPNHFFKPIHDYITKGMLIPDALADRSEFAPIQVSDADEVVNRSPPVIDLDRLGRMMYTSWSTHPGNMRYDQGPGVILPAFRAHGRSKASDGVLYLWSAFVAAVLTAGQLFSLAYPFANAAVNLHRHNLLQATCFVGTCVAGGVALALLPWALRAHRYDVSVKPFVSAATIGLKEVSAWIAHYHEPPTAGALQVAVPVEVLPAELTRLCAGYLQPRDVGLGGLSRAECEWLRREIGGRGHGGVGVDNDDGQRGERTALDMADDRASSCDDDDDRRLLADADNAATALIWDDLDAGLLHGAER